MGNSQDFFVKFLNDRLAPHGAVAEFCRKGGFPRGTVEKWLAGKASPSITSLEGIAAALGVPAWELIRPDTPQPSLVPPIKQELLDLIRGLTEDEAELVAPTLRETIAGFKSALQKREAGKKGHHS